MELIVICAQCSTEFKASGDDRMWICTACGHEVENLKWPFLTRKVAHAKSHRSETDWELMFDELLADARARILALEARATKGDTQGRPAKGALPKTPKSG